MRLTVLFSGQGNQQPEHLIRLRENLPADLRTVLADTIPNVWNQTNPSPAELLVNRIAQPLIFAMQMNLWLQLAPSLPRPVCVAGYSLGEMAACAAAGIFPAEEGILLCAERARAMDDCVAGPAGLLAVKGLPESLVASIARDCGLVIAIRNGPDHFVLGGTDAGLVSAESSAAAQGAIRVVRLGVKTPSHTAFLASATTQMAGRLERFRGERRLPFPVLSAIDGSASRTGAGAVDALARQISTPLDWEACLETANELRPDLVLEIGPGNALARMWEGRKTGIPVRASDDFRSVEGMLAWIRSR